MTVAGHGLDTGLLPSRRTGRQCVPAIARHRRSLDIVVADHATCRRGPPISARYAPRVATVAGEQRPAGSRMLVGHRRNHTALPSAFPVARLRGSDLHPRRIPETSAVTRCTGVVVMRPFDDVNLVAGLPVASPRRSPTSRACSCHGPRRALPIFFRHRHLRSEAVVDVTGTVQRFLTTGTQRR